jgi:Dolichyl-phosphate-mannose-protein mannosyltransferase
MTPPAALVVLPVLACLIFLARASEGTRAWLTQLPIAAPLGLGLSSITWWAFLQVPASRSTMVALDTAVWAAAIGLAFLVRAERAGSRQANGDAAPSARILTWAAIAAIAATSLLAVTSFVVTSRVFPHAGWDAWAIWNIRARFLFRTGPGQLADAFADQLSYSHPDYPLLLPLSVSRAWTFLGEDTVLVPIFIGAIFAGATVAAAALSVGRARTPAHGLMTAAAILASPTFLKWAPSQCADVPLGCYILASFLMLGRATVSDRSLWWLLAGISAGLAAWTKNEGLVFTLLFLSICTAWRLRTHGPARARSLAWLVAGSAIAIAALVVFKWRFSPTSDIEKAFSIPAALTLVTDVDRIRLVVGAIAREVWLGGGTTIGVLPILCVCVLAAGLRPPGAAAAAGLVSMVLLVGIYAVYYIVTPSHDLAWYVSTSVDRLVLHAFPTVVWGLMMAAR